jgi:hypothetical protein
MTSFSLSEVRQVFDKIREPKKKKGKRKKDKKGKNVMKKILFRAVFKMK